MLQRQSRLLLQQSRTATGLCLGSSAFGVLLVRHEAIPRLRVKGWCFQWRLWARRWWLGSDACRCLAERVWFLRGTSWVHLRPPSRWTSRRNSLWHVSEKQKVKETTATSTEQKNRESFYLAPVSDCRQVWTEKQIATNPWCLMSWTESVNSNKTNEKDIVFICFRSDTEALCINLGNILQNTNRKKSCLKKTLLHYSMNKKLK